ncbi:mitochondrial phenylalanyl-tRNA synthetase [Triangularia setosa]|uniref:Argininosuccinate synthase n=1 Tax=Triangularia setosa TaxID=2587417 RepID=A0AAN6W593_9PEZI|nr:mitochondrial phenylalanyl-tRNA synthetase [Podospora setosa]
MSKGRVCLAYSGGLDTSTILKWLILEGYTVVCFLANVGQEEDWAEVEKKALALGAERMVIEDLQREFVEEIVFRAIQCNAIYEDRYLLGTSLARPIIARAQVRVAEQYNCDILSHGCTGKGNDQVRFELAFKACNPKMKVIAPWRMPEFIEKFQGRADLLKFAAENNIPVSSSPKAPWSMDDNLVHCSYEAGVLEDPDHSPPKELWTRTVDPTDAPDVPYNFTIHFEKGIPTKVITPEGEVTDSVALFKLLNKIGHDNGVGRIDIVENRFIGLKSRGCYDTPGLTIARLAHLDLEGLVMDAKVRKLRDQFVTIEWSHCLYNGMYFSPEREFLENSLVYSQENVTGEVRMSVYKGAAYVLGRKSDASNLYSQEDASMDSLEGFSPMDTSGFIAIQAIRLEKYGLQKIKDGKPLTNAVVPPELRAELSLREVSNPTIRMACAGALWSRVGSRPGILRVVRQSSQLRPLPAAATSPVVRCWRARYSSKPESPKTVTINSKTYPVDPAWFNVSSTILNLTSRKLHLQKDHPVSITRQIIESVFPSPTYLSYNNLDPVVTAHENFDSLGFPPSHPGRAKTDTYYINSTTLLRTHTSAHEAELFTASKSPGYLISADVFRRDEIDKSHYPVFHQMEGARVWDRAAVPHGDVVSAIYKDLEALPKHDMIIEDPNPHFHPERNPLQSSHTAEEAEAVGKHLKRSLELMVAEIFKRVKESHARAGIAQSTEPLKVRWVEAYFPFTSPSWELEVWYQDEWLEILGCGVSQQHILNDAGVPSQIGWAFGIGLERIAMLLFQIPDIRLFWSTDERFLSQFTGVGDDLGKLKPFVGFSRHPACYKDVSFWLPGHSKESAAGGNDKGQREQWHENDLMEVVRDVCGDVVEDVVLMDSFTHPKTGRRSVCYRVNYRSLERTLTNEEANGLHERVKGEMVERLGVEIR